MVLKVKSAPNVVDDWKLTQEDNWVGEFIYDIDPCQYTDVTMADAGESGAIRWDWVFLSRTTSGSPEDHRNR